MSAHKPRAPESTAAAVMRTGVALSAVGLATGLALFIAGHPIAERVLGIATAMLVAMPVVNVLAILVGEVRRREWPFVAATCLVITMLIVTLLWTTS